MEVVGRIFEREQDGSIGDGIAGARISFSVGSQGNGTTTGPGGRYSIDLPPGTYAIRAEAQGFSAATTRLVLRESTRPQVLNLFLSRGGAHDDDQPDGVHGRIFERNTDGSIGEPIEGVSVLASRRLGRTTRAVSDADGRFRLKLSPGRYLLSARHEKFRNVRSRIVVQDGFVVRNLFMVRDQPDMMNPPDICDHAPGRSGPVRTSLVMVPGSDQPVRLTYEIIDGLAIVDGGVILGDAGEIEAESEALANGVLPPNPEDPVPDVASGVGIVTQPLLALSARGRLWDGAVVPFAMRNINPTLRRRIEDAMDHISNNSSIEFVPAADDFVDRVIFAFSDDPGASSSPLGRIGGDQTILLNEFFDVGGIVHEILHSLGILHEQSRNDRDNFVDILENNIAPGRAGNFRKSTSGTVDIGPYDYGSIMHYSAWAFGRPAPGGGPMQTIQAFDPTIAPATLGSARNAAPFLTAGDIAGLRRLYPARTAFAGGHRWGSGNYATGVAFGDVDGDGRDELIITRRAGGNGRWFVVEDTQSEFVPMFSGGTDWGDSADGTCCACGDVDGDGRDEVLIGRRHGSNMRFALYDDANAGFSALVTGGDQWGSSAETTAVAIGIDAGVPLIAVARKHDTNARVFVYRYNPGPQTLDLLTTFGDNWGSGNYATGVAFGDVDGDGRLEIAVSRKAGGNSRWFIFNSRNEGFRLMKSGGASWGTGNYATGVAFGDVDGDGRDELVVTRRADENGRWFVFDDVQAQMRLLHTGGTGWGSSNYATACACGDVDGDGRAEIAIARKAGGNARFFVYDDDPNNYRTLVDGGYRWGGGNYATDVALGRSGAMAGPESSLAVARRATGNMRFLVQELSL